MKNCRLTIKINKTPNVVYDFYINPNNTPLWTNSIIKEQTNEWPIKIGTIYRNSNKKGEWSEYKVTALKPYEVFELTSSDGNYHVRYTHKEIDENSSELEYYEWVDNGELERPFTIDVLNKLRTVVESR